MTGTSEKADYLKPGGLRESAHDDHGFHFFHPFAVSGDEPNVPEKRARAAFDDKKPRIHITMFLELLKFINHALSPACPGAFRLAGTAGFRALEAGGWRTIMSVMMLDAKPVTPTGFTPAFEYLDPLDPDEDGDVVVPTTRRGLTRLALVAAETGARFQRERVLHDPMAWMLSPRRLFGGAAAIEACLEREPCLRAVLLHGLALGLDAEPRQIDALLCDAPPDAGGGFWEGGDLGSEPARRRIGPLRLYSTLIVTTRGAEILQMFHASVAPSASVVRERIRSRIGATAAAQATIRVGVDLDCSATLCMLPPVFRVLVEGDRRVRWSEMAGLDVTVEHRIPS
ncbi:MAG TPA: hypothetical protein VF628_09920 [Allosphingosinicella sp.]